MFNLKYGIVGDQNLTWNILKSIVIFGDVIKLDDWSVNISSEPLVSVIEKTLFLTIIIKRT